MLSFNRRWECGIELKEMKRLKSTAAGEMIIRISKESAHDARMFLSPTCHFKPGSFFSFLLREMDGHGHGLSSVVIAVGFSSPSQLCVCVVGAGFHPWRAISSCYALYQFPPSLLAYKNRISTGSCCSVRPVTA